jgi:hypothetical protein
MIGVSEQSSLYSDKLVVLREPNQIFSRILFLREVLKISTGQRLLSKIEAFSMVLSEIFSQILLSKPKLMKNSNQELLLLLEP